MLYSGIRMNKGSENEGKVLRLKSPAGAESAIYSWPLPRYVSIHPFIQLHTNSNFLISNF